MDPEDGHAHQAVAAATTEITPPPTQTQTPPSSTTEAAAAPPARDRDRAAAGTRQHHEAQQHAQHPAGAVTTRIPSPPRSKGACAAEEEGEGEAPPCSPSVRGGGADGGTAPLPQQWQAATSLHAPPPTPSAPMAASLAQEADPPACTLEMGLANPDSKLRVQIFRVNHLTKQLRLDEEDRALQETLRPLILQDRDQRVVIESVGAVSFSAIRQHMDRFKPHCVHFMGHGTEEWLVLVDDDGQSRRYGAAEVATLFSTQPQCFLAVFNCCLSAPIARAVCKQGGVFATIGTSAKIGDSVALAFAKALWGGVLLKPLGAAFTQARLSRPYHLFQGRNPPSPPPTQGFPPSAQPAPGAHLPQLKARLKEQYTSAAFTKIRILDYEANTAVQLEEMYTRLAIVDAAAQQVRDKRGKKKEIESRADLAVKFDTLYSPKQPSHIDHLFGEPGEPTSKRVLVVGRAGIGKTTLSRKIAHLWATGHPPLADRFDLVFRIALRGQVEDEGFIEELLHAECLGSSDEVSVASLKAALQQAKPRVLLLLDGYDEFRSDGCKLLKRLIDGKRDPGFSVLITSRPAAAQQLMRSSAHNDYFAFSNVFELLGFSTAAITEYIGKYFASKPETAAGMVAYLRKYPTVQGAARVPIVAALLCILYESHEEGGAEAGELPSTLTGIFQEMVEYLLGRARLRLQLKGDGDDEVRLQAALEFLEALAWEGMQQGRILFSQGQFEAFSKPPHSIGRATLELALQLGFLTTAESRRANERVARVEYHFLHLTLQEFLAARHLQRTGKLRAQSPHPPMQRGRSRAPRGRAQRGPAQRGRKQRALKRRPPSSVEVFEDRAELRMVWQFGCGLLGADAGDLLRTIVAKAASLFQPDKRKVLLALQCQAESRCPGLVCLLKRIFKDGKVDLSNTQLSVAEVTAVVDVVKRFEIKVLDLCGNADLGVSDADVLGPALRGKRAPKEVRVRGCALAFIARLVHLGATGLRAGDNEMAKARFATKAWGLEIDLSGKALDTDLCEAVVQALKSNTALTSLDLSGNNLRSEGGAALAEALKSNTALTSLSLGDIRLGPDGGAALAVALKGNTTLTRLNLSRNDLGERGGLALAEALKGNTTLASLDLNGNGFGAASGAALSKALGGSPAIAAIDLSESLHGVALEAKAAFARLVRGTCTTLDLSRTHLGAAGGAGVAEALKGNTALTALDLAGNSLGPEGGAALAEALAGNTTLTSLDLAGNSLGPAGGAALAEAVKANAALTTLDLHHNSLGSVGGAALAEALKDNTTLTSLDLSLNKLGPVGGVALAKALRGNTTLTSLNLSGNLLGPEGVAPLAEALKANVALTTLDLNGNFLGPKGGAALGGALNSNTTLTTLDVHRCSLKAQGGAGLAEGLKGNTTLTTLDVHNNELGAEGGVALAEGLQGNTALTSLNLSWNHIGSAGGTALAEALKGNTTLTALDLRRDELGPEGGAALAGALKGNIALATLDLHDNKLGPKAGLVLAEALMGNATLTTLDLSTNNIKAEGGAALAEALKGNTTLTSLDLEHNYLGPEGGTAVAEALKGNTTLTSLNLSYNQLDAEGRVAVARALKGNATLTTLGLQDHFADLSKPQLATFRGFLADNATFAAALSL